MRQKSILKAKCCKRIFAQWISRMEGYRCKLEAEKSQDEFSLHDTSSTLFIDLPAAALARHLQNAFDDKFGGFGTTLHVKAIRYNRRRCSNAS